LDTRLDGVTIDSVAAAGGAVAAESITALQVAGRAGVPADAAAAMLNVTVTEPAGTGYLTVFPCGTPPPVASNLNYAVGQTVANAVFARLGASGQVCLYSQHATHLVVDVGGYFPAASQYAPLDPGRLLDTREGFPTVDGLQSGSGKLAAQSMIEVVVAGRGGAGSSPSAVSLNVTAVDSADLGFATVHACGEERPTASNLNFSVSQAIPNAVVTEVGADGRICIYVSAPTHLVVDLNGAFPANAELHPLLPARLLDTRPAYTTIDGALAGTGVIARGEVARVDIAGRGGVAASAASAVLNVTVTEPHSNGFLTIFACDAARPLASNLNFVSGQTVANLVIADLAADGSVCAFSNSDVHLIMDVVGFYPS
jgi:hypothetical protein